MKKTKIWVGIIIFFTLCGVGIWQTKNKTETNFLNLVEQKKVLEYKDENLGFAFEYPQNYKLNKFSAEDGSEIISFNLASSIDEQKSFQILISSSFVDEPNAVITKDRITTDIPDLKINNSQEVNVAGSRGLKFETNNADFGGQSCEIWFVKDENLYQISGYIESCKILEEITKTWKFSSF